MTPEGKQGQTSRGRASDRGDCLRKGAAEQGQNTTVRVEELQSAAGQGCRSRQGGCSEWGKGLDWLGEGEESKGLVAPAGEEAWALTAPRAQVRAMLRTAAGGRGGPYSAPVPVCRSSQGEGTARLLTRRTSCL